MFLLTHKNDMYLCNIIYLIHVWCIIFSQNKYIPLHFHNGENSQYSRAEEVNQWLKALVTLNRSGYRSPFT